MSRPVKQEYAYSNNTTNPTVDFIPLLWERDRSSLSRIGHCIFFAAALTAEGQPDDKATADRDARRLAFLQKNFKKFVPVQFKKEQEDSAVAALQILPFETNKMEFEGFYYFGFQFTMPAWADGDFAWMFLSANTKKQKDLDDSDSNFLWYIIQEKSDAKGFQNFEREDCRRLRFLHSKCPFAKTLYLQNLAQDRLEPGKTYAIWFGSSEKDFPNIAFAMTIDSKRGKKECGWLPYH